MTRNTRKPPRQERVARNEALFREVNERIAHAAESASLEGPSLFVCECGDIECTEMIEVPLAEYERVRSDPNRFLVRPGHESSDFEQIVARTGQYAVVEKRIASEPRPTPR